MKNVKVEGGFQWPRLFEHESVYKLLYTLQIIEAVMEEGDQENIESIVVIEDKFFKNKKVPIAPPLPGPQEKPEDTEVE